jgi:acyl carrier protein
MQNDPQDHMIEFVKAKILRDPSREIDADTPLISSGMVDSFALLDVLMELEKVTRRRIPAMKVDPKDMDTIRKMFETSQRVGKESAK